MKKLARKTALLLTSVAIFSALAATKSNAALTLLSASESYTKVDASYLWNGIKYEPQAPFYTPDNLEWWRIRLFPDIDSSATFIIQLDHRPSPFSVNYEYRPDDIRFYAPGSVTSPFDPPVFDPSKVETYSYQCQPTLIVNPNDFCTDTFTLGYQPNSNGAGGIFNVTGERTSNVPEPLTILGSGLAIAFGAFLKKHGSRSPIV